MVPSSRKQNLVQSASILIRLYLWLGVRFIVRDYFLPLEIQILSQMYSINCWAHKTSVSPELQIQWLVSTLTTAMQLLPLLRNQLCSEEMPAWPGTQHSSRSICTSSQTGTRGKALLLGKKEQMNGFSSALGSLLLWLTTMLVSPYASFLVQLHKKTLSIHFLLKSPQETSLYSSGGQPLLPELSVAGQLVFLPSTNLHYYRELPSPCYVHSLHNTRVYIVKVRLICNLFFPKGKFLWYEILPNRTYSCKCFEGFLVFLFHDFWCGLLMLVLVSCVPLHEDTT